ncbi:unnamed protein product [Lactuca saligna]|uniref:Defensin-like protein n=1 Tax=Lactuca saligna TaxID=75948 RepID=A0AA35ZRG7_LACSI|nr:unnamed protein product [Lactuca saligna]
MNNFTTNTMVFLLFLFLSPSIVFGWGCPRYFNVDSNKCSDQYCDGYCNSDAFSGYICHLPGICEQPSHSRCICSLPCDGNPFNEPNCCKNPLENPNCFCSRNPACRPPIQA